MRVIWGIFLFALILRIILLDISPPGFNADEAALGYNAYSLIKTGRDEWGESWPIVFRSFSDYKPGLYVYLTIPFVAILGLDEISVRLPSILLGAFSPVLVYLLAKELFKKQIVALSSAFLLSISPWHLHFSRGAWESNAATFFILLGVWAFVKGLKINGFLWISSLAFIASMYTYQSARLVVPFLILLLLIFNWKKLLVKKNIKLIVISIIVLLPLILILPTSAGLARFKGLSMFSDPGPINRINEQRGQHQNSSSFWTKIFHNKMDAYADSFLVHYLDHFSPDFLFVSGGPLKRNKEPDMGQMYTFEIVTLILGIYYLVRNSHSKIVFLWLMLAPIASALTFQTPDSHRSHNMVIPLSLISGLGLGMMLEKLWNLSKNIRYLAIGGTFLIIGISIIFFLERHFIHLPKQYALEWEYGFSQIIPYIVQNQDKYQKVIITDRYDQPYILFLFYSQYDPAKYQKVIKQIGDNKYGFTTISSFDKYEFRPVGKEEVFNTKNALFVGTNEETNENRTLLKEIEFPDGTTAFKIVGN